MNRNNTQRSVCSPAIERILLEIEGQAVKSQPKIMVQPRNFTKENIKRLKEIQQNCKKRDKDASTPTKATTLNIKFNSNGTHPIQTLPKIVYSKERILQKPISESIKPTAIIPNGHLRRSSSQLILDQDLKSLKKTLTKSPSLSDISTTKKDRLSSPILPHSLGTVPKYLLRRKQQWKEEEEKKKELVKDPTIPPGHSLMNDKERLETLELLRKTEKDLLQQLIALPVQLDTMRSKQRKQEIENQLKKAEDGINIFSRSRVLIKHD